MFRGLFKTIDRIRGSADGAPETGSGDARKSRSGPVDGPVKCYSRRMLPPFSGQLQIAEVGDARAFSIDGRHWELQFRFTGDEVNPRAQLPDRDKQLDKYTPVASITPAGLKRQPLHPFFETEAVILATERLFASISMTRLPYPALDRFEYWLLDRSERKPLALLRSCISEDEIGAPAVRPTWMAMPAAQLRIDENGEGGDGDDYIPPVNARLESLVAERAGPSPRAAWFERATESVELPPCLVSEDWENEEHAHCCQLYIRRLAPRLLMLPELGHADRQRLEHAARENALDVDRFHQLYPEIVDRKLLQALRVEASLRRSAEADAPRTG